MPAKNLNPYRIKLSLISFGLNIFKMEGSHQVYLHIRGFYLILLEMVVNESI